MYNNRCRKYAFLDSRIERDEIDIFKHVSSENNYSSITTRVFSDELGKGERRVWKTTKNRSNLFRRSVVFFVLNGQNQPGATAIFSINSKLNKSILKKHASQCRRSCGRTTSFTRQFFEILKHTHKKKN